MTFMVGEFKKNTVTQVGVANVNLALLESGFHSFVFVSLIHYTLQIPRKSKPCSTFKTKTLMQEQHCKHTQEMLFLADTYNTYLGDI